MIKTGVFEYGPLDRVHYGARFEIALLDEVRRLDAKRVFLIVSNTLHKTTNEIVKVCNALDSRIADIFDAVPPHTCQIASNSDPITRPILTPPTGSEWAVRRQIN